jgi:cell division protein FtsB
MEDKYGAEHQRMAAEIQALKAEVAELRAGQETSKPRVREPTNVCYC